MFVLSNEVTLLVKMLKVKGVIASEAWQSHKKETIFSKRLPRHCAPRNDTKLRLLHSVRNDIINALLNY